MKKGKRLLCFGAALSIFCTNVVFAAEFIPPNPLTGGGSLSTEIISRGPGFGIQNPGNENSGNGQDGSIPLGSAV